MKRILPCLFPALLTIMTLTQKTSTFAQNATTLEQNAKATFPGGEEALKEWIMQHLKYPAGAGRTEGRVVVQFTIGTDGTVAAPTVIRSALPEAFGEEALRLIRQMPKWQPATHDGRPAKVRYFLPVVFRRGAYSAYRYGNSEDAISDGLYRITEGRRKTLIGYADSLGRTVIRPQYAFAFPFDQGQAMVTFAGRSAEQDGEHTCWQSASWYIINKRAEKLLAITYLDSLDFTKGLLLRRLPKDSTTARAFTYHYPRFVLEDLPVVLPSRPVIKVADINFDGHDDLLLSLGRYGNQCIAYCDALLWNPTGRTFKRCGAFSDIGNPVCHAADRSIYSSTRDSANRYTHRRYNWQDGRPVLTSLLQETYTSPNAAPRYTEWSISRNRRRLLRRQVPFSKISPFWQAQINTRHN